MKSNHMIALFLLIFLAGEVSAQQIETMSLQQAVDLALKKSDDAKISNARVTIAKNELQVTKNNQYPEVSISGQYRYLTSANVKLQLATNNANPDTDEAQTNTAPDVNHLLLGQANVSVPLFSGFKLKNTIKASANQFNAAKLNADSDKENIVLQTLQQYFQLYKAEQSVKLIEENLKSAEQRVKDFSAMEENGLLARNDLLKAKLQKSNVALSLKEAQKNVRVLNYQLIRFLKLPEETQINIDTINFGVAANTPAIKTDISRPDVEALRYQNKAAQNSIKIAQGNYYPSVSLNGGYVALDLKDALTVTNAMNIGVGLSYNLSDIFKNKSEVKVAKSRATELAYSLNKMEDKVKVQVENARQEYQLALENFKVYQESEEQAVENYRIVKDKYDNGLQDTNDLLEADVQQLQTKINLAYSRANIAQTFYELKKAQGKLISQFNNNL